MTIAIFGRKPEEKDLPSIEELLLKLEKHNINILIHKGYYEILKQKLNHLPQNIGTYSTNKQLKKNVDFMLSIGGDGTFLQAVSFIRRTDIPIAGINIGRLGFLAHISKNEISDAVDAIVNGQYTLESRTLLEFEMENNPFGDLNFALNEITLQKTDSASMITIHVFANNELVNSYWADGLIIATPTGSTAYSLSAGGPIVVPQAENFIITPLAPHNLTVRPLILPDNLILNLKIEGRDSNHLVALDYKSKTIGNNLSFTIKKATFKIKILKLQNHSFFSTLRSKLMWGIDARN